MKLYSIAALATFLAINRVSAGDWGSGNCFPVPRNCDNKCTDQQQTGWDWSGLSSGQSVSSYDGFGFSGFTCSDRSSSFGKRASNKCISGTISKSGTGGSAPAITCGENIDAFSITSFSVYVETETDVTFHFGMPDGSNCQFTSRCGTGGTDVSNDQCGGATSVSWSIPDTSHVDSCGFGIYSIGFDCNPNGGSRTSSRSSPSTTAVVSSSSSTQSIPHTVPVVSASASTRSAATSPGTIPVSVATSQTRSSLSVSTASVSTRSAATSPGTIPVSVATSQTRSSLAISTAPVSTLSVGKPTTIYTVSEVTVTRCASTITNCPANSHTVITKTIAISTTICPVTATETGFSTAISPAQSASSVISHPNSSPSSTSVSSPGSGSSGSCPSVVPKCINTWLSSTCTDNTDVSCYCPSSNVTSSIISCIQAWSSDSSEESLALSYFTGICSGYIGTNPGIVTAVPTTITLAPSSAQTVSSGASGVATVVGSTVPCTTVTYSSSTYVVPQVAFTTATATGVSATTTSVGLVAVTSAPAAAAASTTLSTASSVPGVAGATGVKTASSSSTLIPFTGAAIPGASIPKQGLLLSAAMGMLAIFL